MNAHKATITSIFDGTTLIEIPFFYSNLYDTFIGISRSFEKYVV